MKYRSWGFMGIFALSLAGCGAADASVEGAAEDEAVSSTSQALSSIGTGAFWWDDIVSDVANVAVANNRFEQFQVQAGSLTHWSNNAGAWTFGSTFPAPAAGVTVRAVSVIKAGNRIDLFAVGSDNKVYRRVSLNPGASVPTFGGWSLVLNVGTVKAGAKIAATSWGAGRIDLFWITPTNVIGHAWYDNFAFSGFQTGSNTAWLASLPGFPSGHIEAVSMSSGRIDVFLLTGTEDFMIHHHSWNNGAFGRAEYSARGDGQVGNFMRAQGLAVSASGGNQLHVFLRPFIPDAPDPVNGLQLANLSGIQPNGSTLRFRALTNILPASPALPPYTLSDVVRRSEGGVFKHELWGMGDTHTARLYQVSFAE